MHIECELYKVIQYVYESKDNYLIHENGHVSNNFCYIYFTSNALYEIDSVSCFNQRIISEDRYEWKNRSAIINNEKPRKEIFIRDVWRSWYVRGINNKICTYEKVVDFLRNETAGYTSRCVGVSSGGFMAVIVGLELHVDICYALSAQFSLSHHFDHLQKNSFLRTFGESQKGEYYFEVWKRLVESKTHIIYLFPSRSFQDIEQYVFLPKSNKIFIVDIKDSNHGIALYPNAIGSFISLSYYECQSLFIENPLMKNKIYASIKIGGFVSFCSFILKRIKQKYRKHLKR